MSDVEILGTRFAAARFDDAINRILGASRLGGPFRVYFGNVHTTVVAADNPSLRRAMSQADMVCTDGMPLVWLARRRGAPEAQRVSGPDAMLAICDQGRSRQLRHFFFGGRPGVAVDVARVLSSRYPGLIVAGATSPPIRDEAGYEADSVIDSINATAPDVVWVALGAPKQELWVAVNADRLEAHLVLAVGAAFDFHSGRVRRAPQGMRELGLEWLYRLILNPRRLAGRYFGTNTRFALLLLRERVARDRAY